MWNFCLKDYEIWQLSGFDLKIDWEIFGLFVYQVNFDQLILLENDVFKKYYKSVW